jgi:hypothetical protein
VFRRLQKAQNQNHEIADRQGELSEGVSGLDESMLLLVEYGPQILCFHLVDKFETLGLIGKLVAHYWLTGISKEAHINVALAFMPENPRCPFIDAAVAKSHSHLGYLELRGANEGAARTCVRSRLHRRCLVLLAEQTL